MAEENPGTIVGAYLESLVKGAARTAFYTGQALLTGRQKVDLPNLHAEFPELPLLFECTQNYAQGGIGDTLEFDHGALSCRLTHEGDTLDARTTYSGEDHLRTFTLRYAPSSYPPNVLAQELAIIQDDLAVRLLQAAFMEKEKKTDWKSLSRLFPPEGAEMKSREYELAIMRQPEELDIRYRADAFEFSYHREGQIGLMNLPKLQEFIEAGNRYALHIKKTDLPSLAASGLAGGVGAGVGCLVLSALPVVGTFLRLTGGPLGWTLTGIFFGIQQYYKNQPLDEADWGKKDSAK